VQIQPDWLNGALGFIIPILIQWIKGKNWSRFYKFLLALGSCIVAGIVSCLVTGHFDVKDVPASIIFIFGVAQITYETFWKQLFEGGSYEQK
jgi:hypothetical protein